MRPWRSYPPQPPKPPLDHPVQPPKPPPLPLCVVPECRNPQTGKNPQGWCAHHADLARRSKPLNP